LQGQNQIGGRKARGPRHVDTIEVLNTLVRRSSGLPRKGRRRWTEIDDD